MLYFVFVLFVYALLILEEIKVSITHYENMPMQYTEIFKAVKNKYFQLKFDSFLIFAQNIDCGTR